MQKASIEAIKADAHKAAKDGFKSYWLAEHPTGGFDALTVLAVIASSVPDIEMGTAVVPTFPRHPMVLAGQALTSQTALQGRLCLGIGLSHEIMMAQLGIGFEKPIRHLRDYLSILMPLLEKGRVSYVGETLSCEAQGPQALRVAGSRTDGTTLAWVGPKTIAGHIVPCLTEAASKANRKTPRVISTLPVVVTKQVDAIRERISKTLTMYGELPSYKAMFKREGVSGPADLAIAGSESAVEDALMALKEAGVTDFAASVYATNPEENEQTRSLLISLQDS